MATVIGAYEFYFGQPWWLAAVVLIVPLVWLARRSLSGLGRTRRVLAVSLRVLVVLILVVLLARPILAEKARELTLIVVMDRSQSVPLELQGAAQSFLGKALEHKQPGDQLAVIDVAELASIEKLPGSDMTLRERNTTLAGSESDLARGVQMAMAIAPARTATRILLVSDGNQTSGDLPEAARIAGANGIPIDVLPLRYNYDQEVIFKRIAAPSRARSGQSITLRFVLSSTDKAHGSLVLSMNGRMVDLDPSSEGLAAAVQLDPGTNVKTVSLSVGSSGLHEFEAVFVPDNSQQDRLTQNNRASAVTFVAGPGHVLVVADEQAAAGPLVDALVQANMEVRYVPVEEFASNLAKLMDADAIVLVNTSNSLFTYQQQQMLRRYVNDLGGGLVMVGGPDSFGAGGWIGSEVAQILPVDLDPPQKKQMPKGALVMIMHACEMPRGNFWGKKVAMAAVNSLSRLDLVGVLDYAWGAGGANWVYPLSAAGDKTVVLSAIKQMQMGDMPDFAAPMQAAYQKLKDCDAAQKHMIIISDGDPALPSKALIAQLRKSQISCTGVAVFPHSPADVKSLQWIAQSTGGRFYNVKNPKILPQIFIKEAQVVRRSLIVEESFSPTVRYSLSEVLTGFAGSLPILDGYVLTGVKGGLNQVVLASPKGDPILATGQAGLGRCLAFTASADGRWAGQWLQWGGFGRFWEQAIRWVGKSSLAADCEIYADVRGREVTLTIESIDAAGEFVQFADIAGQVIDPDMQNIALELRQVGPGRYRAQFRAGSSGSHLVNLRYKRAGQQGQGGMAQSAITVPYAPEFQDLSDNSALLVEVATAAGGRVINSDPAQADLFERSGLKFPQTSLPLTKPLIIIWLILFLLDVAVRRIALNVKGITARIASMWPGRRGVKGSETLERLKLSRKRLRRQFLAKDHQKLASKRFEAGAAPVADLPLAKSEQPAKDVPEQIATTQEAKDQEQGQTHLDRLLKAKRQVKSYGQDSQNQKDLGDKENG